jgi:hypothetical protein
MFSSFLSLVKVFSSNGLVKISTSCLLEHALLGKLIQRGSESNVNKVLT